MPRSLRHRVYALAALLGTALPAVAHAQDAAADSPETLAKEARGHYDQGRFEQAVATYLRAYKLNPVAGYLYNVAVIYDRKLNEADLAIDFYRRYIKAEDAEPPVVERAMARIKALKAQSPEPAAPATAPAPATPAPVAPPVDDSVDSSAAIAPAPSSAPPVEESGGSSTRHLVAYTLLGVGGAAFVGGGVLGGLAFNVQGQFKDAKNASDKKHLQALGRSEALAGDVLMGGGFALAGVGVVLLLTGNDGPSAPPPAAEVSFLPLPGGLGVTLGGAL